MSGPAPSQFRREIDRSARPIARIGLPRWRKTLFVATSHLATDAAQSFGLPRDRTVIIGARVDV